MASTRSPGSRKGLPWAQAPRWIVAEQLILPLTLLHRWRGLARGLLAQHDALDVLQGASGDGHGLGQGHGNGDLDALRHLHDVGIVLDDVDIEGGSHGAGSSAERAYGVNPSFPSNRGSDRGAGPGLDDGSGESTLEIREEVDALRWALARGLALSRDLRHLPAGLDPWRDPGSRAVALDLAREQALRTLEAALSGSSR